MRRFSLILFWSILLLTTWAFQIVHTACYPIPEYLNPSQVSEEAVYWAPKKGHGIHQLVLEGPAFQRGYLAGKNTADLMRREQAQLFEIFQATLPNRLVQAAFSLVLMRWFWGVDKYFDKNHVEEMYGISLADDHRWDGYLDPFTRQLALHGLHEIGQIFTDMAPESFGCTVFAVPNASGWVVGRNFDFEGGSIFDEEKILKWVFPEKGYPFVSVIWAGMVGAVTGVNSEGVYISINAAGSADYRRYGTPSTLVLLKALQHSKTAEEAVKIFKQAQMFITDIFMVADKHRAFRVEKSPKQTYVIELKGPTAIANHLLGPDWQKDSQNLFRRYELTSEARTTRGEELLKTLNNHEKDLAAKVVSFLRDKKAVGDKSLPLGNRAAIDALIATHGVLYDSRRDALYVSEGPALVGRFLGYDLKKSFATKRPVEIPPIGMDSQVSLETYKKTKDSLKKLSELQILVGKSKCQKAQTEFQQVAPLEHSDYYFTHAKILDCLKQGQQAKEAYKKALALHPPYEFQRKAIKEKL